MSVDMRTIATHTTGRGFRMQHGRHLAKSRVHGAVPYDVNSWESNPRRHERVSNSHAEIDVCLRASSKHGVDPTPKRRKPPGQGPAALRVNL